MSIFDKAKDAAQKAADAAQQAAQQGQDKFHAYQASKASEDALYRNLGAAFYAEQRKGGSRESVVAALNAVDAHHAAPPPAQAPPTDVPTP